MIGTTLYQIINNEKNINKSIVITMDTGYTVVLRNIKFTKEYLIGEQDPGYVCQSWISEIQYFRITAISRFHFASNNVNQ